MIIFFFEIKADKAAHGHRLVLDSHTRLRGISPAVSLPGYQHLIQEKVEVLECPQRPNNSFVGTECKPPATRSIDPAALLVAPIVAELRIQRLPTLLPMNGGALITND